MRLQHDQEIRKRHKTANEDSQIARGNGLPVVAVTQYLRFLGNKMAIKVVSR